jgi:N-methylhydantoinase A
MPVTYRVGVDIGGTFTDIVVLGSDGAIHTKKVSSSVDDYARALVDGLDEALREAGLTGRQIEEIRHGTTVASNAIVEHKGAKVGLITTKGFRDVLEIRTLRAPRLYDLAWQKPPPLIERYLRKTVDERIDHAGVVERPLDPKDAERAVEALLAERVEAIAVCLINSFVNPAHELAIKQIIARKAPHLPLSVSCEVLPEIKEYERTSTTAIDAYVKPIVATYLHALRAGLNAAGIPARLLLMQSNGGLTTDSAAAERPINIIESGPAGGVIGAQVLAQAKRLESIITFDMGGTTAKASMVEDGEVVRAQEYAVGAGIMIGSRLLTGAGYTLKVPAIDLAEVGAGGGSHVWIDAGGALQVGPASAGAAPGPVCYDLGGDVPTVTDASVILGYINPHYLVGGALKLNAEKARTAFADKVARPLKLSLERAAHGAHQIAASNMIRAIKAVSTERGRDPRGFALFAFGGNGPLFAAGMAAALGIRRIVVPPAAGLFSSFGLLYANVEHHYARTFRRLLRQSDPAEIDGAWAALAQQATDQLAAEGFFGARAQIRRAAALHYKGQTYELVVPAPDGPVDKRFVSELEEAFGAEHERTYGHRAGPEEPVELVAIQAIGTGARAGSAVPDRVELSRGEPAPQPPRRAYFGPDHGWIDTPVLRRSDLSSARNGPLIIEEYDATCLVPPGARAELDSGGNIVVELG